MTITTEADGCLWCGHDIEDQHHAPFCCLACKIAWWSDDAA